MRERTIKFEAIGTRWEIKTYERLEDKAWQKLANSIHERIEAFDKNYSRFRADSLVTKMSKHAGTYNLPDDGFKLLNFYKQLYAATGGKVTPLIGQTLANAGYDAEYSFKPKKLATPPKWQDVISFNKKTITLQRPALLDFGTAGKGYLVDLIGQIIETSGLKSFVINAGGDILYRSINGQAIEVGLENPNDTSEAIGIVDLASGALCASAGSKRKWGNFHHIIDPIELKSPKHIAATWVIANDAMAADGLATALFFVPPRKLLGYFSFSYAILDERMALSCSKNFPAKIFEAEQVA